MSEEMKNTSGEYSADSIQVLEGLEAVRKKDLPCILAISAKKVYTIWCMKLLITLLTKH